MEASLHPESGLASLRLRAIADMVPSGSRVADIGSGHGLLPRLLLTTGRAAYCIASEIAPGNLPDRGVRPAALPQELLEYRFGDGLEVIDAADRIDVVVLAGLGTRTILRILETELVRKLAIKRVVLQPQSEHAALRRTLIESRYCLVDETLVWERGRYYFIIAAELRSIAATLEHPSLTPEDLYAAGPELIRSGGPIMWRFWSERLTYYARFLENNHSAAAREHAQEQLALAQRVLRALPSGPPVT